MEFNEEIVHGAGIYQQAADARSLLSKMDRESVVEVTDVDDDIPTYCTMGQVSDVLYKT